MKKILLASAMTALTSSAFAQAGLEDQLKEAQCKTFADGVSKAEKATLDPKKGLKSATWVKLAEAHIDMAMSCGKDSIASKKAFDAYKKAIEVEKSAGGKGLKALEEQATGNSSKLYSALMQQGATYYNAKNTNGAFSLFQLAVETSPKDTTAALYAGIVAQQGKDNASAKTYFNKFVEQGGKDIAVFYGLSELYKADKEFSQAVNVLKKGMAANPKDKDLQSALINTYLVAGLTNEATETMKQMIAATPNTPENAKLLSENVKNLGTLYESLAYDVEKKIRPLENDIVSLTKEKAGVDKDLAAATDKKSAFEEELKRLNAQLKKAPKTATKTKADIANVTSMIASSGSEIESLTSKITILNEQLAKANANASQLDKLKQEEAELKGLAVKSYEEAIKIDPTNFDANYNLGVYYFNKAVVIKGEVGNMDMKTYNEKGKAIEEEACNIFSKAKVYFDACNSIKPDDQDLATNYNSLKEVLKQCSK